MSSRRLVLLTLLCCAVAAAVVSLVAVPVRPDELEGQGWLDAVVSDEGAVSRLVFAVVLWLSSGITAVVQLLRVRRAVAERG